jgi:hypothetical protein
MYNEQTNAHLTDSLLYCSVFIAPTCFNSNAGPSQLQHQDTDCIHGRLGKIP